MIDYVVVGAGLTGAVIARQLHDAGKKVLVLERQDHVGGNCHDVIHPESGIRHSLHGPHYFRTSSEKIWNWAKRFSSFRHYEAVIRLMEGGQFYNWPITNQFIRENYPDWTPPATDNANFEATCLGRMPRELYEKLVKPYTEKQWGRPAAEMLPSLAGREGINAREEGDVRLSTKEFQGIPVDGYTVWIENILKDIPVELGVDYLSLREYYPANIAVIYTGKIDAFFGYRFGNLEYRSQQRELLYFPKLNRIQPVPQVNYPHPNLAVLREIEWKHIWPSFSKGTLITRETPIPGGDEYPVPDAKNQTIYQQYRALADALPNVLIEGRLGRFIYWDMDQAIANALTISERLLN